MTLPVPLTSLVGREREMAAVEALLATSRLVTLTGAAGSGKTRLALAVANRIADGSGDPVDWIDLAPVTSSAPLAVHLLARLGIPEQQHLPPMALLTAALSGRRRLLVLDNCEHLVGACAALVEALLTACPALRVLATSREALTVGGERAWLVPLLPLHEAVALFTDRAVAVQPGFELSDRIRPVVEEICRGLDGLPLAVELAAARITVLAPEQLRDRLDEGLRFLGTTSRHAPPRQRTLRGALDWSHALLDECERILFARLAVFPGSFSLTAMEQICADPRLPPEGILSVLAGLVEKSLVMMELRDGEARYRLLEMVRQYARERLVTSDEEAAIRQRHATHYLALAEQAEEPMLGLAAAQWIAMLDDESPNFQATFDWASETPDRTAVALRLGTNLYWFWRATGRFAEGRARLDAALSRRGAGGVAARAQARTALAILAFSQGERGDPGIPDAAELAELRRIDDPLALSFALLGLGMTALLKDNVGEAREFLRQAVTAARRTDRPVRVAQALYWLGSAERMAGDLPAAARALEEAVALCRPPGVERVLAYCTAQLALVRLLSGDFAAALSPLREALAIHRLTLDTWGAVQVVNTLAGLALQHRRPVSAVRLLGAASGISTSIHATVPPDLLSLHDRFLTTARAALEVAAFDEAYATGRRLDLPTALAEADAEATALASGPTDSPEFVPVRGEPGPAPVLRVRALGPLQIEAGGVTVPLTAWRAARPRELLLHLLCHPAGRTREQIALTFWPDASTAQVKNNFHVALHHLRRAVGRTDIILFEHDRYRIHWELGVVFDAGEFDERLRPILRRPTEARDLDALRALLETYQGEFLADADVGDWHLDTRDRLRRLHAEGQMALGAGAEAASRHPEAAEAYRRLLRFDPLDERASRALIRVLATMGERREALREYERLERLLRIELHAAPANETRRLAELIRLDAPLTSP